MLVQPRAGAFRLVRQHDHGLLTGALAGAWRAEPRPFGLPWTTVVAASLHDVVWLEEDRTPRLDPDTGRPHDFVSLPPGVRHRMLEEGLPALEAVEPTIAALVQEHHHALREGRPAEGEAAWVRFTDALALRICLTLPGGDPSAVPAWLDGPGPTAPDGGPSLTATWAEARALRLDPFPFGPADLHLAVPFRDIPRRRYDDDGELRAAWDRAEPDTLRVRVTG